VGTTALGTARASSPDLNLPRVAWRGAWRRVAWRVAVASMAGRKRSTAATQRQMARGKGNNGSVA